jgi:predicted unusual protein kinase regulating ubiquinone biosynthesis (AarF/ABC1/UbiB family)
MASGDDRFPVTRLGRLAEIGRFGVRASTFFGIAGARGLIADPADKKVAWTHAHENAAAALFESLGRMRGAAAKIGQLLAQRPGFLPEQYVELMFDLSNRVPPMGYGMVKTQFLSELGRLPGEVFAHFEREPVAAASFGQVHRAVGIDGSKLAVKVQYPGALASLDSDLRNVRMLLEPVAAVLNLRYATDALEEVETHVVRELDYRLEAKNMEEFARLFAGASWISIPKVHAPNSRRVLTMTFLEGTDLRSYLAKGPRDAERQAYGLALLRFAWKCMFEHRMLHADPNPGNYLFHENGVLGVLDFGCVKRFPAEFVKNLADGMRAQFRGDTKAFEETMRRAQLLPENAAPEARAAILRAAEAWGRPFAAPGFDFSDRKFLEELVDLQSLLQGLVSREAPIPLPKDWMFYGRHILGITYLLFKLGARGNFNEEIAPYL